MSLAFPKSKFDHLQHARAYGSPIKLRWEEQWDVLQRVGLTGNLSALVPKGTHTRHKKDLKFLPSLNAPQKCVAALLDLELVRIA